MKRALLIPLIVLLLATVGCNAAGTKSTSAAKEPTQAAAAPEKATQPAAKEAAATEAPAAAAGEVKENFDSASSNWSDPVIVTSQASGRDPLVNITIGDGIMRFSVKDKETYVYKFFSNPPAGATTMEVDFTNKGVINTGVAMVCKVSEDHSSWYELRFTGDNSYFTFYQYDKKLKDEQGKNPYTLLGKGRMGKDQYFPIRLNHVIFTCGDGELSVDVNNGTAKGSQQVDASLTGNLWGLGATSADLVPVNLEYDNLVLK